MSHEIDPDDVQYPLLDLRKRPWLATGDRKPINPRTIWRWKLEGLRGKKLRTSKVGGAVYTCDRWVREFFDREQPKVGVKPMSPAQRARRMAANERELAAAGI